jgi:hypothetical protein
VILILGVLAAVALPRYADLQGKAREAKVKAVAGSMKAASGLVKASAMANGVSCGQRHRHHRVDGRPEGRPEPLLPARPWARSPTGVLGAANVASADGWTVSTAKSAAASPARLV